MNDTVKALITLVVAVPSILAAVYQYTGKEEAEAGNKILIEQQNKLIEKYEQDAKNHNEEIKRYQYIISFLDSNLRTGQ